MDHLINDQKKQFIIIEFSTVAQGRRTIDPRTTALLLGKLGFDVNNTRVSDLLNDANTLSDGHIDLDSILSIVDKLSNERSEPIPVIDDEPDEVQLLYNLKEFLKRMKQLNADNILVTDEMFKQFQQEYNVPDHLFE